MISMAKAEPRAVPSGKVYRQLFEAQVQLSRSLLAGWKNQSAQSNTQCSTASSAKELVDTDDSEEVSGLPDALATSGSSSDVIERFTIKKITKHQETLEHLDTELTAISKNFESHVRATSEELLSSLYEVDLRLDKLSHKMELTEELKSYSLQDMCSLWEEVEQQVNVRKSRIMEFHLNLCQTETQRTVQIQAVLKRHCGLLEMIGFLPLSDIQRLLHFKATILNQSLLANRRSVCQLRLNLLVVNQQRTSVLHQHWEDSVEQWRSCRINQIIQNFSDLCIIDLDEGVFSDHADFHKIKQSLQEVSVNRKEIINSLCSLVPPSCTSDLVSDWFEQLKILNHQIDGLHADLLRCIRNCHDQTWQERLEEVHSCENSLRDLQLSQAQTANIVSSSLLPLIGHSQSKADEQLAAFDESSDSLSRHSLSLSSSVFRLMHQASFLWEEHCFNLKNIESKIQRDVEKLRDVQGEQLQRKRLHLDEHLSILRQESNEEGLNVSMDKALLKLQELHDSCRQNLLDQDTVLDRLPVMYLQELQNYSTRLSMFFHLSSVYTPRLYELDPAFRGLGNSLFSSTDLSQKTENKEVQSSRTKCQEDSALLDLCHMNSSEEWSSSQGLRYSGPRFTCCSPELDPLLKNTQLEVFPTVLLSQTLSRVRSMFVEQLEQHFHHSLLSALSLLSDLRQQALTEQDVQLQQLSAQRVHQRIFQPRLAELQLHQQQVDLHGDRVSHTICSLKSELKQLLECVSKRNQTFSSTVSSLESGLPAVGSLQRLETLSSTLKDCLENHMADTRFSQINFRKSVQVQLEQLKQATTQLLCSLRLFSEGGNFASDEIKMFQKKLKRDMNCINVAEESIHSQLEAFHSSSLQQVKEVYTLQEKLTWLKSEFMFMEKTKKILRSTKVKIKAVAATINQQQSHTSSKIQELQSLLDNGEAQVCQSEVCSALSTLCQTLHQRLQYLDFTMQPLDEASPLPVHSAVPSSALQPHYAGGVTHDDPLLRLIKSINRDRASGSTETALRGGAGQSAGPLQKKEDCPPLMRRGCRARVDWRLQMFGPRPEAGNNPLSCSSKVSALLWEASDALILVAEDFYRSSLGVSHLLLVPDNLEQWTDNIQQRLQGYLEQAKSFLSSSKNEFVKHISSLDQVCLMLPKVLIHKHELLHEEKLVTEMDRIRQELDHRVVDSEKDKTIIVGQLRVCISGEALQTLVLQEQQRQQVLSSAIDSSIKAQKECLQLTVDNFVVSLASLTEKLLGLLDLLITNDELKATWQHSENTEGTAHCLSLHSDKRTWQGIPYFHQSASAMTTASITTKKCTLGHEVVIRERDTTVKRFGELYRRELLRLDSDKQKRQKEVENWSVHWRHQLHTLTDCLK